LAFAELSLAKGWLGKLQQSSTKRLVDKQGAVFSEYIQQKEPTMLATVNTAMSSVKAFAIWHTTEAKRRKEKLYIVMTVSHKRYTVHLEENKIRSIVGDYETELDAGILDSDMPVTLQAMSKRPRPISSEEALLRWPRVCAHMICHSLGYATPLKAAQIVLRGHRNERDNCEWIDACYGGKARVALQGAVMGRHHHSGYMKEYQLAKRLVLEVLGKGEPSDMLAAWF
jgi:hypothetical protein